MVRMNQTKLQELLVGLPIEEVRYFDVVDSTNSAASRWAESGAPGLALVVANEQTSGRGRAGRQWFTPKGAGLAFSLLINISNQNPSDLANLCRLISHQQKMHLLTALGALAIVATLREEHQLEALVKWPNDVLVNGRKLAGVLVELSWEGDVARTVTLGIGINVTHIPHELDRVEGLPAASVEDLVGKPVDRWNLLRSILARIFKLFPELLNEAFILLYQERLAYLGNWVRVTGQIDNLEGRVLGLSPEGLLRIETLSGGIITLSAGEIHLRLVDRSEK